jgi:hypothetical protein
MRLIALCALYEEPPELIAPMLAGLARIGVDHVVFLDGAYALYPGGKSASHPDMWMAAMAGFSYGMGITFVAPKTTWAGNEVEKRTALFRHGLVHATLGEDWFVVVDADEFYVRWPEDLKDRLAATDYDVATVHVYDMLSAAIARASGTLALAAAGGRQEFDTRRFFRAQEIVVGPNHFTYRTRDGRVLWQSTAPVEEPALDLSDVVALEHHPGLRSRARQAAKWTYYTQRDESGFERGRCIRCDASADVRLPHGWKLRNGKPAATFAEFCDAHGREQDDANRRQLYRLGFDPDTLAIRESFEVPA